MGKNSKALATVPQTHLSTMEVADSAWTLAQRIAGTPFVPEGLRGDQYGVLACILTGHEAGVSAMQSISKIHVIKGKPAVSAELMRGMILAAGHDLDIVEMTSTRCVMVGKRLGKERETRVEFSMDDAKRANLSGSATWRAYPQAMLLARCTSLIGRAVFPDVLAGLSYTSEELEDGSSDPEDLAAVEATTTPKAKKPAKKRTAKAKKAATAEVGPAPDAEMVEPPAKSTADLPPLPGEEDPDDDIVDAEVIEDETPEPWEPEVPLPADDNAPSQEPEVPETRAMSPVQALAMRMGELGVTDKAHRLAVCADLLGIGPITTSKDLSDDQIGTLLRILNSSDAESRVAEVAPPAAEDAGLSGSPDDAGGAAPEPEVATTSRTADEWRALCKKHKVTLTKLMAHASDVLGHKVITIDDMVNDAQDLDWLADWVAKQ